jgi:hypothetical protein
MLTLRRGQVAALLQGDPRGWLRFVCESIEEEHPRSPLFALPAEERLDKVRDWCERAQANGLSADDDVLTFVFMMHELAPDFDQHPRIRGILDRAGEPVEDRFERLFDTEDEALDLAFREAEERAALPEQAEQAERAWHLERSARVEEAFPESHLDPRFVRCFERIMARRRRAPDGGPA